jgi:hypothetical protein
MSDCTERRKDGSPCTVRARPGRPFCAFHDPDLQGKREAARVNGGANKATSRRLDKLTPATLHPLLEKFIGAVDAVESGTLEPKQATAMAALGGVILKFYELGQLEATLQDTQARLDALERGQSA